MGNSTSNLEFTISKLYEDTNSTQFQTGCTLSIHQIIYTIWSLLCILANILLMFFLSARGFKEPLNFIMLGWSMSNLMYIGLGLYFGVISFACMTQWTKLSFVTSIIIFINLSEIQATFILVQNVLRYPKRCYIIICLTWILALTIVAVAAVLVHSSKRITLNLEVPLTGVVNLSCLLTLCAKVLAKHIPGFRALVSSITIFSSLLVFIPVLIYFYFRYEIQHLLYTFILFLYGASFLNLILLIYYHYETREFILKLFRFERNS